MASTRMRRKWKPCTVPGCGGIMLLTIRVVPEARPTVAIEEGAESESYYYKCDTCGAEEA